MFISQSAVSNRLISLEKELNVKLIERSPGQKGILLTQKGEEFVQFAKRHQELNRQIQDWSRGDVTEVLRVASVTRSHRLCERLLPGTSRKRKALHHSCDSLD